MEGRVYRSALGWRVLFGLVLVAWTLASGVRWTSGELGSRELAQVLFFNLATVGVMVGLGSLAFKTLVFKPDSVELRWPLGRRVVRREDVKSWWSARGDGSVVVLKLRDGRTFVIAGGLMDARQEVIDSVRDLVSLAPKSKKALSPRFGPLAGLGICLYTVAAIFSSVYGFGLPSVFFWIVFFVSAGIYLSSFPTFVPYIDDGVYYKTPSHTYYLGSIRGMVRSMGTDFEDGLIVVFGYDRVFVSGSYPNYQELASELGRAFAMNKLKSNFKPLPSDYWDEPTARLDLFQ